MPGVGDSHQTRDDPAGCQEDVVIALQILEVCGSVVNFLPLGKQLALWCEKMLKL